MNRCQILICSFLVMGLSTVLSFPFAANAQTDSHFQELQKKAIAGDRMSKFELGWGLVSGHGIKQDCKTGMDWLKQSSADGFAPASFALWKIFEGRLSSCHEIDNDLSKKYNALYLEQSKSSENTLPKR